ncbi:MAG: HigA family addiction module antidote protein [Candidatus Solibacter usitatus]|nr:HigA family addiction module antidote protein [Candidatus Solibacter usitatus]
MTSRSSTTTKSRLKKARPDLPPVHPGEILFEDLMRPLSISTNRLARDLRVPVTRIGDIVHGRRGISADTALRLGRYFKTSPEFWQNLQSIYELNVARRAAGHLIERDVQPLEAA